MDSLHPDGEPSRFVSLHRGVIRYEREKDGKAFKIGRVLAYRLQAGLAADAAENLFEVCDAHSAELLDAFAVLYEPSGYSFREQFVRRYTALETDLLLIDYVVIHPHWRGLRLGLLALRRTADLLGGGCSLVASRILPLSPDGADEVRVPASWIPRHETTKARRRAAVRLRRYARRMGFVRVDGTSYYVLPLNHVTPSAEDLLRRPSDPEGGT